MHRAISAPTLTPVRSPKTLPNAQWQARSHRSLAGQGRGKDVPSQENASTDLLRRSERALVKWSGLHTCASYARLLPGGESLGSLLRNASVSDLESTVSRPTEVVLNSTIRNETHNATVSLLVSETGVDSQIWEGTNNNPNLNEQLEFYARLADICGQIDHTLRTAQQWQTGDVESLTMGDALKGMITCTATGRDECRHHSRIVFDKEKIATKLRSLRIRSELNSVCRMTKRAETRSVPIQAEVTRFLSEDPMMELALSQTLMIGDKRLLGAAVRRETGLLLFYYTMRSTMDEYLKQFLGNVDVVDEEVLIKVQQMGIPIDGNSLTTSVQLSQLQDNIQRMRDVATKQVTSQLRSCLARNNRELQTRLRNERMQEQIGMSSLEKRSDHNFIDCEKLSEKLLNLLSIVDGAQDISCQFVSEDMTELEDVPLTSLSLMKQWTGMLARRTGGTEHTAEGQEDWYVRYGRLVSLIRSLDEETEALKQREIETWGIIAKCHSEAHEECYRLLQLTGGFEHLDSSFIRATLMGYPAIRPHTPFASIEIQDIPQGLLQSFARCFSKAAGRDVPLSEAEAVGILREKQYKTLGPSYKPRETFEELKLKKRYTSAAAELQQLTSQGASLLKDLSRFNESFIDHSLPSGYNKPLDIARLWNESLLNIIDETKRKRREDQGSLAAKAKAREFDVLSDMMDLIILKRGDEREGFQNKIKWQEQLIDQMREDCKNMSEAMTSMGADWEFKPTTFEFVPDCPLARFARVEGRINKVRCSLCFHLIRRNQFPLIAWQEYRMAATDTRRYTDTQWQLILRKWNEAKTIKDTYNNITTALERAKAVVSLQPERKKKILTETAKGQHAKIEEARFHSVRSRLLSSTACVQTMLQQLSPLPPVVSSTVNIVEEDPVVTALERDVEKYNLEAKQLESLLEQGSARRCVLLERLAGNLSEFSKTTLQDWISSMAHLGEVQVLEDPDREDTDGSFAPRYLKIGRRLYDLVQFTTLTTNEANLQRTSTSVPPANIYEIQTAALDQQAQDIQERIDRNRVVVENKKKLIASKAKQERIRRGLRRSLLMIHEKLAQASRLKEKRESRAQLKVTDVDICDDDYEGQTDPVPSRCSIHSRALSGEDDAVLQVTDSTLEHVSPKSVAHDVASTPTASDRPRHSQLDFRNAAQLVAEHRSDVRKRLQSSGLEAQCRGHKVHELSVSHNSELEALRGMDFDKGHGRTNSVYPTLYNDATDSKDLNDLSYMSSSALALLEPWLSQNGPKVELDMNRVLDCSDADVKRIFQMMEPYDYYAGFVKQLMTRCERGIANLKQEMKSQLEELFQADAVVLRQAIESASQAIESLALVVPTEDGNCESGNSSIPSMSARWSKLKHTLKVSPCNKVSCQHFVGSM
eukprot:GHVQ01000543.1.p1 GENE.GHVQ01000543.1~~GHVQ01000543.1.p1  ORF type:complete len:1387 (-),score=184.23 GHVQ01000543.1:4347-8507(-)